MSMDAGLVHNCALRASGMVRCWGMNNTGQVDVKDGFDGAVWVAVGGFHSCVITKERDTFQRREKRKEYSSSNRLQGMNVSTEQEEIDDNISDEYNDNKFENDNVNDGSEIDPNI